MKTVKAFLLAAGLGTRLSPLTHAYPKPLLMIRRQPLIEHWLSRLAQWGVSDVRINLHHHGDLIQARIGSGRRYGIKISYQVEPELLKPGGSLKAALPWMAGEPCYVISADIDSGFDCRVLPELAGPDDCAALAVWPLLNVSSKPAAHWFLTQHQLTLTPSPEAQPVAFSGIGWVKPRLFESAHQSVFDLSDVFTPAIAQRQVVAQIIEGHYHNVGTWQDMIEAREKEAVR